MLGQAAVAAAVRSETTLRSTSTFFDLPGSIVPSDCMASPTWKTESLSGHGILLVIVPTTFDSRRSTSTSTAPGALICPAAFATENDPTPPRVVTSGPASLMATSTSFDDVPPLPAANPLGSCREVLLVGADSPKAVETYACDPSRLMIVECDIPCSARWRFVSWTAATTASTAVSGTAIQIKRRRFIKAVTPNRSGPATST